MSLFPDLSSILSVLMLSMADMSIYLKILLFFCTFRYYAIVHPLSAIKISSKSRTKKMIALTWIIPLLVAVPYMYSESYSFTIYSDYGTVSRQTCQDKFDTIHVNFRRVYFLILFFLLYFVPMLIIIGTCTKIAICLVQPINIDETRISGVRGLRRTDEVNKRKVIIIYIGKS